MNVDLALDKTVRLAQQGLTSLQVSLRELCALDDQAIDPLDDWKIAVDLYDKVEDWVEKKAKTAEAKKELAALKLGSISEESKR